jgi:hypothetical protein
MVKFLEHSGPLQACNRTVLPFTVPANLLRMLRTWRRQTDNAVRQITGDGVHSTEQDRIQREASTLEGKFPFERRQDGVIGIW